MPGYRLVEERMLQPFQSEGLVPHPNRMGFLDYMRELRQDQFPFPSGYPLLVVGLEDVLLAAGTHLPEVASFIHRTLVRRANELDSLNIQVQLLFTYSLHLADDFWIAPGVPPRLSLRSIFGRPRRCPLGGSAEFFFVGFNLT
ncbi:MAG: hypothetical protein R3B95_19765 [Nitrospirales bacterium]|nr:hypothetical protein [Nitrospirales bacterium]